MIRSSNALAAIAAFMALSAPVTAQETGSKLPGGASSLQETYQDWNLSCQGTPQTVCVISQQQMQQSGQRVLAIELRRDGDGGLTGNLVLPFGLLLDAGAALQVDAAAQQKPLRFSTCLPAGCLVPLAFDANTGAALKDGTALKVTVHSNDAKEVTLSISLKGMAAAVDRLEALGS
jgi:invasion protein IalB